MWNFYVDNNSIDKSMDFPAAEFRFWLQPEIQETIWRFLVNLQLTPLYFLMPFSLVLVLEDT